MFVARVVLIVCCSALSTAACAQFPGGGHGGMGGMGGGHGGERPSSDPAPQELFSSGASTQAALDSIEDALHLTDAQRGAWNAYADRVQKLADETSRLRFDLRSGRVEGSATEQLQQVAIAERSRMSAVDEIAALGKTLYPSLTLEQRAIADRRLAPIVLWLTFGAAPGAAADRGLRGHSH